jgi:ribosome maturation factor RimP
MKMKQTKNDPVIDEVREVRHRISARFDHDPSRLVAYYLEMQKQYEDRLLKTGKDVERSIRQIPRSSPCD